MQTMPTKTRTSLIITVAAALVLVVGIIGYSVLQRSNPNVEGDDPLAGLAEPENGLGGELGSEPTEVAGPPAEATETPAETTGSFVQDFLNGTGLTASPEGETATAASTSEGTTLNSYEAVPLEHVVAPNETLYDISMKYYDTHIYAGDIEALNDLEDPDMIQAGTRLQLPRPDELQGE
jgi:LysM repeat protein